MIEIRTRAEIQAQIKKLQEELKNMPEREWKVGDRVAAVGRIAKPIMRGYTDVIFDNDNDDETEIHTEALIPASDLIPRAEHERALAEAQGDAQDAAIRLIDLSRDYGGVVVVSDHPTDGHTYRVTVERVDDADPQPTPELIGYANLLSDGKTWGSIYATADGARNIASILNTEIAVPLYRHPTPATAVAPKGVVEELRSASIRIAKYAESSVAKYSQANNDHEAALSRITELPEPSEGYSEWAKRNVLNQGWTENELKQIPAALLAKVESAHD